MRYTSDSFARSCEQQQQQQEQVDEEKEGEELGTSGLETVDEDQPMPSRLAIQVEGEDNRMDEGGGKGDVWGGPGRDRDEKGRVVVVEKWDAFTALSKNKEGLNKQGHTGNGDGLVNHDHHEDEEEVPGDEVLPTDWREIVSGRREVLREPSVETTPLPVLSSVHPAAAAGVGRSVRSRVPMSDDLDEETVGEFAGAPRDDSDTSGRGDTDADTATAAVTPMAAVEEEWIGVNAAALPNVWEDVGARVSVYYLEQPGAGEGGLFGSTEESFRLDESFSMDPTAAASATSAPSVVSVRTIVMQIELLQQEEEPGKPEQEVNGRHFDDTAAAADGVFKSSVAAVTDDADGVTAGSGQRPSVEAAQAAGDQPPPPASPPPPPPSAPKKSKILFIMHAKAPPDGDTSSLASIEVSARSLFRDMLIRMLAAGSSSRNNNNNNNDDVFHSPPRMSLLSPLAVTAAYPHLDYLNNSLLSQQSAQSVESLDSLVAGADGWGTHPRHLYSLRMTLVDDQDDDEVEEPTGGKNKQPSYFSPTRRPKRDLSQSMVGTPLGLSSRAKGQSHTITQPHSQLRLMLVSPPKSPKKAPPNWGHFARRIQRLARRFLARRRHAACVIQHMTRRRRLLHRWHAAVTELWQRATTAVLRIQMLVRRYVAQCRVQVRREDRCVELERRIEQLVVNDIQVTHLPPLVTYINHDLYLGDHPFFSSLIRQTF